MCYPDDSHENMTFEDGLAAWLAGDLDSGSVVCIAIRELEGGNDIYDWLPERIREAVVTVRPWLEPNTIERL